MTKVAFKNVVTMFCEFAILLYTGAVLIVKGICNNIKALLEYV